MNDTGNMDALVWDYGEKNQQQRVECTTSFFFFF